MKNNCFCSTLGEWGEWSDCPFFCRLPDAEPIQQTRTRQCYNALSEDDLGCESIGPAVEGKNCGDSICPSEPSWSRWAPWESCSTACKEEGLGNHLRRRICLEDGLSSETCITNPPEGESVQFMTCMQEEISCPEGIEFGEWTDWGACDITCNARDGSMMGIQLRTRTPQYDCSGKITI